jgi:hypothetical protein
MALSPEREASSSCVRPAASRSRRNCVPNGAPCSGVSLRDFPSATPQGYQRTGAPRRETRIPPRTPLGRTQRRSYSSSILEAY